jgi:transcriptional regulator with XRE-family HTH domain
MTTIKLLCEVIQSRRKLLQLTQIDLAEISEISLRSLKSIELGDGNPGLYQIGKLLDAIGLQIEIGAKKI